MFTSSCPGEPQPPGVRTPTYSYGPEELLANAAKRRDIVMIHRGPAVATPHLVIHPLYREHLAILSTAARGQVRLTRRDVVDLLSGRLHRWETLGHGVGAIRLLAHGAPINQRTLLECLAQQLGLARITAPVEFYGSYRALTEAAVDCSDSIVFGLRPAWINGARATPVILDGIAPWSYGPAPSLPSFEISLAWHREFERSGTLGEEVSAILTTIGARLQADALALRALREEMPRLAA